MITFFENSIVNTVSMQSAEPSSKTGQPCPEFVELTSDDVRKLIEDEENKNTMKKTLSDVQKFERFLLNKGEKKAIYQIEPDLLDEYVANFILSVRKADGAEYEPTSIRNIVSSLDRKLKRHKYPFRLIAEQTNAFQLTRDALRAKTKSLKRLGKGNKPLKASPITDEEINMLYEKKILGPSSAASLPNTVWINNCIQFGLRGTKENHDLRWGDVELKTSSSGLEYLALNERQTKTRTGSNIKDIRDVTPKMFAMPEDIERCPVHAYKQYAVQRPTDFCTSDDPFYIAPRTSSQSHVYDHEKWFVKMKLGEKKLGGLLKKMASDGGLDSNKRITNHSTRKHLVQKLRDSGIAPTDMMQISGHKNIQSIMNYSEMSEEKHQQCSRILSKVRQQPTSTITGPESSVSQLDNVIDKENRQENLYLPHPRLPQMLENVQPPSSTTVNSISVVNDNISLNTQMNSLFAGAVLNIQHFNINMN
ncbi:transcriptional regulator QRICH1-like [Mya arenaria]|uniref:transcriptional regulator QRICH1-like n=1 Tax=Mya arenaria TaxID=6604 RepID=UPI0022E35D93|nr:transcriptional regulator QRICH1-like [Mya arenaria]